jgi:transcription antitermination factor NusG
MICETPNQLWHEQPAIAPLAEPQLLSWFALRVKSNFERVTALSLRQKGIQEYLPTYLCRRRRSDRVVEIEQPLFPGYVFCRLNVSNRLPVLMTPGVVHIVGNGNTPVPVPTRELEAVQALLESGFPTMPWPFLRTGQKVLIERGPLAGVEGTLVGFKSKYRLVVSIELLQRSVAAEVEGDWLRPLRSACSS